MKRFLLLLMACATMFASCQKDADLSMGSDGGMVDVTISAAMEGASATTRAIESFGTGAEVDRCIMEVYLSDGTLYKRMIAKPADAATDAGGKRDVTFELRLVADKTYDFLFWADDSNGFSDSNEDTIENTDRSDAETYDNLYDTSNGLKAITTSYTEYVGSDETRDAFFGQLASQTITSSVSLPVTLTRPFGQINVSTGLEDVPSSMYPQAVKIVYSTTVGDTFNVLDGTVGGTDTAIEWEIKESIEKTLEDDTALMHLSTDYLFASDTEQDIHNFAMTFYSDEAGENEITTNSNFKNIPVQRNYRTNISGELLTKQGTITVTIDPTFATPDIDITAKEVASVSALQTELNSDVSEPNTSYTIAETVTSGDSETTITIKSIADAEGTEGSSDVETSRTFDFSGGIADGTTVTIAYETTDTSTDVTNASEAPDVIYITVPEDCAGSIELDVPYSTVYINGSLYEADVWTAGDTFIVQEGASITTLTVSGGNVEIYGEVNTVEFAESNTTSIVKVWTVYNQDQFDKALALGDQIEKIVLAADMTLASAFTLSSALEIDGGGNTLTISESNTITCPYDLTIDDLKIAASTSSSSIYPIYISAKDVDLKITNSEITYTSQGQFIRVNGNAGVDGVNITVEDTNIYMSTTSQAAISFVECTGSTAQTGSSITLTRSTIKSTGVTFNNSTTDNASASYAIGLGHMDDAVVTITDSELLYMAYPIHCNNILTNYPNKLTLTIDNSVIKGWCALNMRCDNSVINIQNGSELVGRNYYSDSDSNYFDTIVYAYNGNSVNFTPQVHNTTLNISDSEIRAEMYGKCNQWVFDNREGTGNTVNFNSGTKLVSKQYYSGSMMESYSEVTDSRRTNTGLVINREEGVTLEATYSDGSVMDSYRMLGSELIGEGTEGDPYQIWDDSELFLIADASTTGNGDLSGTYYYKQMNDLTFNSANASSVLKVVYNPMVNLIGEFKGVYDGNNYSISGFGVDAGSTIANIGLFGTIAQGAVVENLNLVSSGGTDISIASTGSSYVGSFAAINLGTIMNCTSNLNISVTGTDNTNYAGGIAAQMAKALGEYSSDIVIDGCTYSGNLSVETGYGAGILAYFAYATYDSWVQNNIFSGSVTAPTAYAIGSDWIDDGNTSTGTVNGETVIITAE